MKIYASNHIAVRMMQMLTFVALAVLPACSQSTQHESEQEQQTFSDLESYFATLQNSEAPNYGTLRLHCNRDDVSEGERSYYVEAFIFNEEKTNGQRLPVDGGPITISDVIVSSDPNAAPTPYRYFHGFNSADSPMLPAFGQTSSWAIAGNPDMDIPALDVQMYVPAEIAMTEPQFESTPNIPDVSVSQELTISWNADPDNSLGVIVHVTNYDLMFANDPNLPVEQREYAVLVPDNGEYTLPANALDKLPIDEQIEITLMRGNFQEPTVDGKEFFLYAVTIDHGRLMLRK